MKAKLLTLENPIPFSRFCSFEIKEMVQKPGDHFRIKGYASTFENIDRVDDKMVKGCFDKTLKKSRGKWPVKLEHKDIIGFNETAMVDDKGLYVESSLFSGDEDIPLAKTAIALIKNCKRYGHKLGLSVGGMVKQISYLFMDGKMVTEIKEFDVLEHSITGTPANPEAKLKTLSYEIKDFYDAVHNNKKNYFDFQKKLDEGLADFKKIVGEYDGPTN